MNRFQPMTFSFVSRDEVEVLAPVRAVRPRDWSALVPSALVLALESNAGLAIEPGSAVRWFEESF